MEPAYLYGFEKYSKEFNILNENPVICKRIEDIILKTKKDYHNHIVEKIDKLNKDAEKFVPFQKIHYQSALTDLKSLLQDTKE